MNSALHGYSTKYQYSVSLSQFTCSNKMCTVFERDQSDNKALSYCSSALSFIYVCISSFVYAEIFVMNYLVFTHLIVYEQAQPIIAEQDFFYFIEMKANLQYTSLLNFQHENDVNILLHETEHFYPFLYCKYLIYYSENGNRTHYYIIVLIILQSVILQMLRTNPSPYKVINLSMHPFKLMSSILRENVQHKFL